MEIQGVYHVSEEDVQLTGSDFVITMHLFFIYPSNLVSDNCFSTTASQPA